MFHDPWPWDIGFDKRRFDGNVVMPNTTITPAHRRRLLIKAAAMLVAEIERHDRAQLPNG